MTNTHTIEYQGGAMKPAKYPNVRIALARKQISQTKFAELVGTNESYASQIIIGVRNITEEEKLLWSFHLGEPVEELFKTSEEI